MKRPGPDLRPDQTKQQHPEDRRAGKIAIDPGLPGIRDAAALFDGNEDVFDNARFPQSIRDPRQHGNTADLNDRLVGNAIGLGHGIVRPAAGGEDDRRHESSTSVSAARKASGSSRLIRSVRS